MRRITSIFLSGPDLFYPGGERVIAAKQALCEEAGFIGVSAQAGRDQTREPDEAMARELYADALVQLRSCEAVIANLTPWRGPGCDPGTAFEVGFAAALGLPVFAYVNVADEEDAEYRGRVESYVGAELGRDGVWRDPEGCVIEDFGLAESLMLWAEARRLVVIVTPEPMEDVTGVEVCLEALALYAE